eukprot:1585138-Amphidinium_carterae.1
MPQVLVIIDNQASLFNGNLELNMSHRGMCWLACEFIQQSQAHHAHTTIFTVSYCSELWIIGCQHVPSMGGGSACEDEKCRHHACASIFPRKHYIRAWKHLIRGGWQCFQWLQAFWSWN